MTKNRIIMVEDDEGVLADIKLSLKQSGYDCALFLDNQKVVDSLEEDASYDLVPCQH